MELWEEQIQIERQLNEALSTLRQNGLAYCEAERQYQMLKSKEILRLKSEGYPITIIRDIVKGLENVANLDFERNKLEVVYRANIEAINIKKLQLKVKQTEIDKEYYRNE